MIDFENIVEDFIVKHAAHLDSEMINDLNIIASEMYGDGWCKGFQEATEVAEKPQGALEWWEDQDKDEEWIEGHKLADLEEFYGEMDLQYLQTMLEEIDKIEANYPPMKWADLQPGHPLDKRGEDDE